MVKTQELGRLLDAKENQLDPFLLLAIFPITYMQHSFLGNNTLRNQYHYATQMQRILLFNKFTFYTEDAGVK
jgi:hypothetical protein